MSTSATLVRIANLWGQCLVATSAARTPSAPKLCNNLCYCACFCVLAGVPCGGALVMDQVGVVIPVPSHSSVRQRSHRLCGWNCGTYRWRCCFADRCLLLRTTDRSLWRQWRSQPGLPRHQRKLDSSGDVLAMVWLVWVQSRERSGGCRLHVGCNCEPNSGGDDAGCGHRRSGCNVHVVCSPQVRQGLLTACLGLKRFSAYRVMQSTFLPCFPLFGVQVCWASSGVLHNVTSSRQSSSQAHNLMLCDPAGVGT